MCGYGYMFWSPLLQGLVNCNRYNEQEARSKIPCLTQVTVIFQDPSKKKNNSNSARKDGRQRVPRIVNWGFFPLATLTKENNLALWVCQEALLLVAVISGLKIKASTISYQVYQLTALRIGRKGKEKICEARK